MLHRSLHFLLLLTLGATQLPACAQAPETPKDTAAAPTAKLPWLQGLLDSSAVLRQHQVGISLADAATGEPLVRLQRGAVFHAGQHDEAAELLRRPAPAARLAAQPALLLAGRHAVFSGHRRPYFSARRCALAAGPMLFCKAGPKSCWLIATLPRVPAYGPSWSWDDYNYYFQPERTAFPLYGNTVRFYAAAPLPRGPGRVGAACRLRGAAAAGAGAAARLCAAHRAGPGGLPPLARPSTPAPTCAAPSSKTGFYAASLAKKWVDEVPFRTSRTLLLRLLGDTLRRAIVGAAWRPRPGATASAPCAACPSTRSTAACCA